jgi:hypothetical protein
MSARRPAARLQLLKFEASQRQIARRKQAAFTDLPPIAQKAARLAAISKGATGVIEEMIDNILFRLESGEASV